MYRVKELTQQLDELTKVKQDKETAADPKHSARLEIEASLGNKPPSTLHIFIVFTIIFCCIQCFGSGFIEDGSGSGTLD